MLLYSAVWIIFLVLFLRQTLSLTHCNRNRHNQPTSQTNTTQHNKTKNKTKLKKGFVAYALAALAAILYLIWVVAPAHGTTNIFVYTSICSLAGSLSVTSCKALGIALKLTFGGDNQLVHLPTYVFVAVRDCCCVVCACCVRGRGGGRGGSGGALLLQCRLAHI